jgi:hypothetical protein
MLDGDWAGKCDLLALGLLVLPAESLSTHLLGRRELECDHIATLRLPSNNRTAVTINAMNLKHRLRNIGPDCRARSHVSSSDS